MELHMTEAAVASLCSKLGDAGCVRLVYDSEGCNAPFPVIIDNHQSMYFEAVMRLDVQSSGYYRLSSNQQIYTTHLASVDKRSTL